MHLLDTSCFMNYFLNRYNINVNSNVSSFFSTLSDLILNISYSIHLFPANYHTILTLKILNLLDI